MVSKTRKYIDFDICGLQDRYIGLPDGLGIESPLLIQIKKPLIIFLKTVT